MWWWLCTMPEIDPGCRCLIFIDIIAGCSQLVYYIDCFYFWGSLYDVETKDVVQLFQTVITWTQFDGDELDKVVIVIALFSQRDSWLKIGKCRGGKKIDRAPNKYWNWRHASALLFLICFRVTRRQGIYDLMAGETYGLIHILRFWINDISTCELLSHVVSPNNDHYANTVLAEIDCAITGRIPGLNAAFGRRRAIHRCRGIYTPHGNTKVISFQIRAIVNHRVIRWTFIYTAENRILI